MLSLMIQPLLLQLPLAEAGQLLLVMFIAFAIITLIASTSRFHKMIQLGEEELTSVDDCNDFFFIQVTRYLIKINRVSSGFVVLIVQFRTGQSDTRAVQEEMLLGLRQCIREDSDKACLFRDDCVAAMIDVEEEKAEVLLERLAADLKQIVDRLPDVLRFRAGASTFPMHGDHSRQIIDAATEALEQADFDQTIPVRLAPQPEMPEQIDAPEEAGEITRQDRQSLLDPLTGVLKPESIGSYMRKYLLEIRRKKGPAAVLCVGINRIDHIISLHGEEAADAVIRGVSEQLQELTRETDLIGRYHRDDFLVMVPCSLEQGEMIALRLREAVQKAVFLFEGKRMKCSVSIGISAHPEHGRTFRDLFRGAYAALGIVREWDTSSCLIYDPAQHDKKVNYEPTA